MGGGRYEPRVEQNYRFRSRVELDHTCMKGWAEMLQKVPIILLPFSSRPKAALAVRLAGRVDPDW